MTVEIPDHLVAELRRLRTMLKTTRERAFRRFRAEVVAIDPRECQQIENKITEILFQIAEEIDR